MGDITRLLHPEDGTGPDLDAVFERLYPELRQRARGSLQRLPHGATLTPTTLVAEAYMRLIGNDSLSLNDRRHFYACAARAMRHVILDGLRSADTDKRRAQDQAITLSPEHLALARTTEELLDLDQALDELEAMAPQQRELVDLKFFVGLSMREIAELFETSERTAWRDWKRARAWLKARLKPAGKPLD